MKERCTKGDRKPVGSQGQKAGAPTGLRVVHPNAAGMDVGAYEHYVSVPEDRDERPVRRYGCLTPDLHEMARWLVSCGIQTVALEATGVYWKPVAQVLESHDLEVVVADASDVKNVKGRKSDVKDCQWLRELHTFGLLKAAFRPTQEIQALRSYWRHRHTLVQMCAQEIHRIQKALEQMNLQVHKLLSDISGVSGMRILRAILKGERDAETLAALCHAQVKSSPQEMVKALTGEYRAEHLFALRHAVELYDLFQQKIAECDQEVQKLMATFETQAPRGSLKAPGPKKAGSKRRKNQCHFDLQAELFRITGVDVTRIDGIDALTAMKVFSEVGYTLSDFPTEHHWTSWMGTCPNNQKTGGKVRRTRTRRVQSRVALAFRLAAQALRRSDSALGGFLRRLTARLGPAKAITATARKIACLFYRMVRYGQDYVDQGERLYQERYKQQQLHLLQKRARQMGYALVAADSRALV